MRLLYILIHFNMCFWDDIVHSLVGGPEGEYVNFLFLSSSLSISFVQSQAFNSLLQTYDARLWGYKNK